MKLMPRLPLTVMLLAVYASATAHDVVFRQATVADGTGGPLFTADVAVQDGRVQVVGKVDKSATIEIDAKGLILAPGFIDVHTHSEKITAVPVAENFLRMGVTTIVTGNCGTSKTDIGTFFADLEATGMTLNVATLIGHNSIREKAMGGSFIRPPSPAQMDAMKEMVEQAMKQGAVGLSTGLIYLPGTFAKTEEIVELAKVASQYRGIYASHMRSESNKIFEAMDELLHIARAADIPVQLSHIKLSGPSVWGRAAEVLSVLDRARSEGLRITHDQYVYTASSTSLSQLIPDAAREGGRAAFIKRISDPAQKANIVDGMKKTLSNSNRTSYDYAVIAQFKANEAWNGKSVTEVAKLAKGSDALESQIETILEIEKQGGASAVFHGMNEADLRIFLQHPLTMIASDGNPREFGEAVPHPRSYGNNARLLKRYVRDEKLLTLEDGIRRMTSLPAQTFQLTDRGVIKPGAWADLVAFDLAKVDDPSAFKDPHHYASGFSHVMINGQLVIHLGQLTAARPGGPLRLKRP
jgi:N-acyl-D-amino-acid deacylase